MADPIKMPERYLSNAKDWGSVEAMVREADKGFDPKYLDEIKWTDVASNLMVEQPALGVAEQAIASQVPPEHREAVLRRVSELAKEKRPYEKAGYGSKLATSFVQGAVDFAMPFVRRMGGGKLELDPDQERFKQALTAAREGADPVQSDSFLGGNAQKAARMVYPMVSMVGAGKAAGGVAKAFGAGTKAQAVATGVGVSGASYPMAHDQAYDSMVAEGISPDIAGPAAKVSGAAEAAIESILPDPLSGYAAAIKGSVRQVAKNLVVNHAKTYGKELSEEALQGMTQAAVAEVARYYDENVPEKGIGEVLRQGLEATKESAVPLAMLMSPGMAMGTAQTVSESAQRKKRLDDIRGMRAERDASLAEPVIQREHPEVDTPEPQPEDRPPQDIGGEYAGNTQIKPEDSSEVKPEPKQQNAGAQPVADPIRDAASQTPAVVPPVEQTNPEISTPEIDSLKNQISTLEERLRVPNAGGGINTAGSILEDKSRLELLKEELRKQQAQAATNINAPNVPQQQPPEQIANEQTQPVPVSDAASQPPVLQEAQPVQQETQQSAQPQPTQSTSVPPQVSQQQAPVAGNPVAESSTQSSTQGSTQPPKKRADNKKAEQPAETLIGKNSAGQDIYEDSNGVRTIVSDGVRNTEPVEIRPTRGVDGRVVYQPVVNTSNRRPEFEPSPVSQSAPPLEPQQEKGGDPYEDVRKQEGQTNAQAETDAQGQVVGNVPASQTPETTSVSDGASDAASQPAPKKRLDDKPSDATSQAMNYGTVDKPDRGELARCLLTS